MSTERHIVYRALNRPLTIGGVERRLFLLAASVGLATMNLFSSAIAGLALFLVLFVLAQRVTAADPAMLRIILNASRYKTHYDPCKWAPKEGESHGN